MSLSTFYLEYSRHLRRRRRSYAPTSNTAGHDNHEEIHSGVSFPFLHGYGAPLGGRSSATKLYWKESLDLNKVLKTIYR